MMSRSRSRSPIRQHNQEETGRNQTNKNDNSGNCDVLHIKKIPTNWYYDKIYTFIGEITSSREIIDGILFVIILKESHPHGGLQNTGEFLLKFNNAHICKMAYEKWKYACKDRQMEIIYDLDNLYSREKKFQKLFKFIPMQSNSRPNPIKKEPKAKHMFFQNDSDNHETYGLSMEFLKNLNIRVPFGSKLFISNLHSRVDEAKLREVFGLAGQIVYAKVIKKDNYDPPKYFGKVQYDHPVEAVQAISMFHNQSLYNYNIIVHMDTKPSIDIPDGLSGLGPGLGTNGKPLSGVRNRIELQSLKNLNPNAEAKDFDSKDKNYPNSSPFVQSDRPTFTQAASNSPVSAQQTILAQTPMVPTHQIQTPVPVQFPNQQTMNSFQPATGMMNLFNMPGMQNMQMANLQQMITSLLQNNMNPGVMSQISDISGNPNSEWQTQLNMGTQNNNNVQPNFSDIENRNNSFESNQKPAFIQRSNSCSKYDDRSSQETKKSSQDKDKCDMLLFKNLPRSVTVQALENKMQEVGELKFAEITGQGRAVVRFVHIKDAERCIKLFNRSKVDGQIIEVRYF